VTIGERAYDSRMARWSPRGPYRTLDVGWHAGVLKVVFNRPERLNAFDQTMSEEFLAVLVDASTAADVRSVVITGAGRAFSAGADIRSEFTTDGSIDLSAGMRSLTNPTILALREIPKPVVAAVNGPAAGLGCSIALASDLVLAADESYFLLAFANIGLHPDGGATLTLAARVGLARAFRMALLAERVPAADAFSWGMIDQVLPGAALLDEAEALAVRLAEGPTQSFAATKRALNAAVLGDLPQQLELEAELQGALGRSADFAEGVAAFGERRTPSFTGS
jgi:2-(1,2-epoxy-1,2-dihydrophenyl)acetyl-CoA isomerase